MSNGCVLVASHAIGSVPFLIKDRITGMIFKVLEQIEALGVLEVQWMRKLLILCVKR